jgi:hypothetical protein
LGASFESRHTASVESAEASIARWDHVLVDAKRPADTEPDERGKTEKRNAGEGGACTPRIENHYATFNPT